MDNRHRRGSVYVIVLISSMIVTTIGLSAMLAVRIQFQIGQKVQQTVQAQLSARAGLEMALYAIEQDPNWRSNLATGLWTPDTTMDGGSFKWRLTRTDPADPYSSAVLTASGTAQDATRMVQVTLVSNGFEGLDALKLSLVVQGNIQYSSNQTIISDQTIGSNSQVDCTDSAIYADVVAKGGIVGNTYYGTTGSINNDFQMPNSSVYDYYIARGTPINIYTLPLVSGEHVLEDTVLAAGRNPFGLSTNAQGIYVIDCHGEVIVIQNCRIEATLVLIDAGGGSRIAGQVNWRPAMANFPALLVDTELVLSYDDSLLDEAAIGVNFNPSSAPYNGNSDNDMVDSYPSLITGLIYIQGDLSAYGSHSTIDGVLLTESILQSQFGATLELLYQPIYYDNSPPGFQSGEKPPRVQPGSWRKIVN